MPTPPPNYADSYPAPLGRGTYAPPDPPPQSQEVEVRAKWKGWKNEFVSGGAGVYSAFYRSLPQWIDDTTRDFGDDLYERMLLDEQVYSSLYTVIGSVLADGLEIRPKVDDKDDPGFREASDFADFARRNLGELERTPEEILREMLGSMALGNRVAEMTFENEESGEDAGKIVLDKIKVKPRRAVGFIVDLYLNLVGMVGRLPGESMPAIAVAAANDLRDMPVLPKEKFAILTYDPKDNDPRGSSLLRSVYRAWWSKIQTTAQYMKYLAQFAMPSLVGILGESAFDIPSSDALGNLTPANGQTVTQIQGFLNELIKFQGGTAIAIPHGADVKAIFSSGGGEAFLKGLERFDQQIAKGITLQSLATEDAQHGSRAQATVHQDTMGLGVRYPKELCARMFERQVVARLITMNFGEEACRRSCPQVTLSTTEQQDQGEMIKSYSTAKTAGLLLPQQLPAIYKKLGWPDVDPVDIQAAADAALAAKARTAPGAKDSSGGDTGAGQDQGAEFGGEGHDVSGQPRAADGKFGEGSGEAHPGSTHGSTVKVKKTTERAFSGQPAQLKTTLTKQETGRVGEAVSIAYLKTIMGRKDARAMNTAKTNFPVDALEDHVPTEIKAGLASNTRGAQQWRLTFSKESAKEKALYDSMTAEERKAWNADKQQRIHDRKEKVIKQLEKETGKKIKPRTMTCIINPDSKIADVYIFEGLHDRIDWQSEQARNGYAGSVKYA